MDDRLRNHLRVAVPDLTRRVAIDLVLGTMGDNGVHRDIKWMHARQFVDGLVALGLLRLAPEAATPILASYRDGLRVYRDAADALEGFAPALGADGKVERGGGGDVILRLIHKGFKVVRA